MIKKIAVIVAAGNGTRMGSAIPKQFLLLQQKPILWHSIAVFQNSFPDIEIILVIAPDHLSRSEEICKIALFPERIRIVFGGDTRFESVKRGLAMANEDGIVFVHDAVRCLVTQKLLEHCYHIAKEKGSAVPAVVAQDSIRLEMNGKYEPADRSKVRLIQTPQTFFLRPLKKAFQQPFDERFTVNRW